MKRSYFYSGLFGLLFGGFLLILGNVSGLVMFALFVIYNFINPNHYPGVYFHLGTSILVTIVLFSIFVLQFKIRRANEHRLKIGIIHLLICAFGVMAVVSVRYFIFDFASVNCESKDIGKGAVSFNQVYDLRQVAGQAKSKGIDAHTSYVNYQIYFVDPYPVPPNYTTKYGFSSSSVAAVYAKSAHELPANYPELQKMYGFYTYPWINTFGQHLVSLSGPQLKLAARYFGIDYKALVSYTGFESDTLRVQMQILDLIGPVCTFQDFWLQFFTWKMFRDSGLEANWVWHSDVYKEIPFEGFF